MQSLSGLSGSSLAIRCLDVDNAIAAILCRDLVGEDDGEDDAMLCRDQASLLEDNAILCRDQVSFFEDSASLSRDEVSSEKTVQSEVSSVKTMQSLSGSSVLCEDNAILVGIKSPR